MSIGEQGEADTGIASCALNDAAAPGRSSPDRSAAWMMPSAVRSLTEPPGLRNSALPKDGTTGSLGHLPEVQQGGVADKLSDVVGRVHGASSRENARRVCHRRRRRVRLG